MDMKKYSRLRKILLTAAIVVITLEALLLGTIAMSTTSALSAKTDIVTTSHEFDEAVLTDIVLPQMTRQLEQVRTAWMAYTETYGMELLTDADNLDMFLETSVRGIRAFGNEGDAFVFNSKTGEYYLEYSADINQHKLIFDAVNDANCANPTATREYIASLFWENDVLDNEYLINLWSEAGLSYSEASDLIAHPLGTANREFTQKIMLPLPSVGEQQIVVVLGVKEQDIVDSLADVVNTVENTGKVLDEAISTLLVLTLGCMFGSIVIASIANFVLIKVMCQRE